MRRLTLDEHGIPTREETAFAGFQRELGEAAFDDGFALIDERSIFALSGAGRRVSVEMLGGYTHAQVFAPPGKDLVALEPMTAPANALVSGRGLRVVEPGGRLRAGFRIGVVETEPGADSR
jgi:aldose 1-epimerase